MINDSIVDSCGCYITKTYHKRLVAFTKITITYCRELSKTLVESSIYINCSKISHVLKTVIDQVQIQS